MEFKLPKDIKIPPRISKTRLGCQTCKDKHRRCDLSKPACRRCVEKGQDCPGYSSLSLTWIDGPKIKRRKRQTRTPSTRASRSPPSVDTDPSISTNNKSHSTKDFSSISSNGDLSAIAVVSGQGESSVFSRPQEDIDKRVTEAAIYQDPDDDLDALTALFRGTSSIFSEAGTDIIDGLLNPPISISSGLSPENELRVFLSIHYFTNVVPIFTIFDTPSNPFGEGIQRLVGASDALANATTCIAAIHLADSFDDQHMRDYGLTCRAQATTALHRSIDQGEWNEGNFVACILLSMTESYFVPIACGTTYLESAKHFISLNRSEFERTSKTMRNAMCWVEALASLVDDYSGMSSSLSETHTNANHDTGFHGDADPILGTWAPLLPRIGRLTELAREARQYGLTQSLQEEVLSIEAFFLSWIVNGEDSPKPATPITSEESEGLTPKTLKFLDTICLAVPQFERPLHPPAEQQFAVMAQAYSLGGLVQLYCFFPHILRNRATGLSDSLGEEQFLCDLSDYIISIMKDIPFGSRLFNVGSFPLLAAGQFCKKSENRTWVLSIFDDLRTRNGIAAVGQLGVALQEVWQRYDNGVATCWLDVFSEWNWKMLIN